jgi:hypothetical protein
MASVATHFEGQSIPPPETWPLPAMLTVSCAASPASTHDALTLLSLDIAVVHETLDPEHAPPQPLKIPPGSGVWTTLSMEPSGTLQEQVEPATPQSISLLPPVTVPLPANETESVRVVAGDPENVAVISWSCPSEGTSQVSEVSASHGPSVPSVKSQSFQLTNVQPVAESVAVSVAAPPKLSAHVFLPSPHVIPLGLLVTRPLPTTLTAVTPVGGGGGGGVKTKVAVTLCVLSPASGVI